MKAKEFIIELKKESKPRNFVAKNAKMGGAGQHKDKKKAEKQGDVKHKVKQYNEEEQGRLREKLSVVRDPSQATGVQRSGGITHGSVYIGKPQSAGQSRPTRGVDAKGRTQAEFLKLVKQKFPTARIMQARSLDGPVHAMLPDGRKISWIKVNEQGVAEGAEELTPNMAKYVLDQIYNSNGAVTMTDLFDEGITGLRDMFMATAEELGLDPDEDFMDVESAVLEKLEDLVSGGQDVEEDSGVFKIGDKVTYKGQPGEVIAVDGTAATVHVPNWKAIPGMVDDQIEADPASRYFSPATSVTTEDAESDFQELVLRRDARRMGMTVPQYQNYLKKQQQDQEYELGIGSEKRAELKQKAEDLSELKRQQLRKERMEDEAVAHQRYTEKAERDIAMEKIKRQYDHELTVINTQHKNSMETIKTGNSHDIDKLGMEQRHEMAMLRAQQDERPSQSNDNKRPDDGKDQDDQGAEPTDMPEKDEDDYVSPKPGDRFDPNTGRPIYPQYDAPPQAQVGYEKPAKPSKYNDDDIIDVDAKPVKPNKPLGLPSPDKKISDDVKRLKDLAGIKSSKGVDEAGDYESERDFRNRERNAGLETERNNLQVSINGRPWKVFPGRGYADSQEERSYLRSMQAWAEKKSAATGKKWSVSLTGLDPS